MRWPRWCAVLLVAVFLAAPVATAQIENPTASTPTNLYFHIWDPFNKFVVNTQPYNASFFDVGGVNFPSIEERGWDFNTIYGYSTAGPVEYDFNENGRPRLHPERGIAQEIQIDPEVQPVVYLYVDARALDGDEGTPGILPQMTFRVNMRQGDDPGSDFNTGPMIMSGELTAWLYDGKFCPSAAGNINSLVLLGCAVGPADTTFDPHETMGGYGSFPASGPDGNPILYPSPEGVIEVAIPMTLEQNVISKTDAFNLRIDWWQEANGARGEDTFAQGNMRIVMDETHQSRLSLAITNPIYIEFMHPQVAAGTLLIHTGVNSPWGTYDVDESSIVLTVDGPSEPQALQQVIAKNQHVHGLHDQAAEITYLWPFRDEGAAQGQYTITMEVSNMNGTATAKGTAGFRLEGREAFGIADTGEVVVPSDLATEAGAQGAPAPGLAFAAAAVAIALAARRRRA